jgi:hypothetical protein
MCVCCAVHALEPDVLLGAAGCGAPASRLAAPRRASLRRGSPAAPPLALSPRPAPPGRPAPRTHARAAQHLQPPVQPPLQPESGPHLHSLGQLQAAPQEPPHAAPHSPLHADSAEQVQVACGQLHAPAGQVQAPPQQPGLPQAGTGTAAAEGRGAGRGVGEEGLAAGPSRAVRAAVWKLVEAGAWTLPAAAPRCGAGAVAARRLRHCATAAIGPPRGCVRCARGCVPRRG